MIIEIDSRKIVETTVSTPVVLHDRVQIAFGKKVQEGLSVFAYFPNGKVGIFSRDGRGGVSALQTVEQYLTAFQVDSSLPKEKQAGLLPPERILWEVEYITSKGGNIIVTSARHTDVKVPTTAEFPKGFSCKITESSILGTWNGAGIFLFQEKKGLPLEKFFWATVRPSNNSHNLWDKPWFLEMTPEARFKLIVQIRDAFDQYAGQKTNNFFVISEMEMTILKLLVHRDELKLPPVGSLTI